MTATPITVRRILVDQDCRQIYSFIKRAESMKLRKRQALLVFNAKRTMARVFGPDGVYLTCYAQEGHRYDVDTLLDSQEQGFGLELRLTGQTVVPLQRRKAA